MKTINKLFAWRNTQTGKKISIALFVAGWAVVILVAIINKAKG